MLERLHPRSWSLRRSTSEGRAKGQGSLSLRLAIIAAAGTTVALLLAAILFISLFRDSLQRSFDFRLVALHKALVGAVVASGEGPNETQVALGEPRFSLPQSGWYWQIRDMETGAVLTASPSLFGDHLAVDDLPDPDGRPRRLSFDGPGGRGLRAVERQITKPDGKRLAVLVAGDARGVARDISRFTTIVAITLGIFGLLLAIGAAVLIRFGLRPLRDVRAALQEVRRGERVSLGGQWPDEIAPLAEDLDALILSNREIVERARRHVGNLAHALKTPLAILQNEAEAGERELAERVGRQVEVMRGQIGHHLDRARIAAQTNVIGAMTPVAPVVEALARVMQKVHGRDRPLEISVHCPATLVFRGEKQDLEEMVGNLLDNACKWAGSEVTLSCLPAGDGNARRARLIITDDGPGLAPDERKKVLARGMRLDETKPGSGLGLSIVDELARIYGGALTLEAAPEGGLKAVLDLPVAEKNG
ncbi:ATP-binding protein [Afifella sp. H1R]|uniref:ATP-binding protein n=1 Tax=Afifella sp. H1R TaxID=2908841 RepID=UPI001F27414A|nr:ATP-binding protein [Afifella sp. H1R]MCF1505670.1 ATP-binding protein [Afifella sp. H1R]